MQDQRFSGVHLRAAPRQTVAHLCDERLCPGETLGVRDPVLESELRGGCGESDVVPELDVFVRGHCQVDHVPGVLADRRELARRRSEVIAEPHIPAGSLGHDADDTSGAIPVQLVFDLRGEHAEVAGADQGRGHVVVGEVPDQGDGSTVARLHGENGEVGILRARGPRGVF